MRGGGLAGAAALAVALGACGDDLPRDEICGDRRAAPGFDVDAPFCDRLSTYGLFSELSSQTPATGVLPFQVNSALFADRADKDRFVWLPSGEVMTWSDPGALELPVGAVLIKTFGFPTDARDPSAGRIVLETRLLVHRPRGWEGVAYVYDRNGEGRLAPEGASLEVAWRDGAGAQQRQTYLVPNKNQCKNCHEETEGVLAPLGPKARHLNRDGADAQNQLQGWIDAGLLVGAPPRDAWPRSAVSDDPQSGTLEERARAWLDISCAHCHNPRGAARTSGLDLSITAEPAALGVCKAPVATGRGSAGRKFDIVPGQPDASIIMARLESTEPEIKMPELGRTLIDEAGVALIREWITAMPGSCAPD
ncbi:MAG: SO2930 family diheme c-type cytochrome [Kofleriaceae bacterium]